MKRISFIFATLISFGAVADDSWMNEAYGTYEGVSANTTKSCGQYVIMSNSEIDAYNESNGYWDEKDFPAYKFN